MLPAPHRLRLRREFATATRRGRRAGAGTLVVHLARPTVGAGSAVAAAARPAPARVGVVVSRACGPAVVRNRIKRRLRHRLNHWLSRLPAGAIVVVRALPAAAGASTPHLDAELSYCLDRLLPANGGGAAA